MHGQTKIVVSTLQSYTSTSLSIPGQYNDSINIQILYTATTKDFMRIITKKWFQPLYY